MTIQYTEVKGELFLYNKQAKIYLNTLKLRSNTKKNDLKEYVKRLILNEFNQKCEFKRVKNFDKS